MPSLLSLSSIRHTYPNCAEKTLADASLSLEPGDTIALLGDNGSGKSTLLHIASGLIKADGGSVFFKGKPCETENQFSVMRRSLGYLLQHSEDQLFCPTILEDVAFGPVNTGMREKDAARKAMATLERLGLEHLAARNGSNLSGGQKKLAALATILVMEPEFLFLDEPTNDLDQRARATLLRALEEIALPRIIISHDEAFLKRLCNRFLLLENGVIRPGGLPRPDCPQPLS